MITGSKIYTLSYFHHAQGNNTFLIIKKGAIEERINSNLSMILLIQFNIYLNNKIEKKEFKLLILEEQDGH